MKVFMALLAIGILFSCQKNKGVPSTMAMADLEAVELLGYNHLVNGTYLDPGFSRLDLDQDGVFDVRFYSGASSAESNNIMPEVTIETLHSDVQIQVDLRQDSLFHAYFYHWQYAPDGTRAFFHVNRTSCERETEQYLPAGVQMNQYLVPLKEGETVSLDDTFGSGTFFIATAEEHSIEIENFPDSTVYHIDETSRTCFQFPQKEIRYLAFKIEGDYGQKMGWIEVVYLGGNKLRIGNWAIQK